MNDGAVTPTPLVQSLGLGQLNCRRLWSRDGSIHDGFMGLVSCLDQLGLQVLCVQETQSLLMSSLLVDQPFRYDGLLAVMVARRVSCSTLQLRRPLSLGPLAHSPFAGASSQPLHVSAHSMPRILAFPPTLASSSGARSQPQSIASRSSTRALRFFLQGTPTFGSPYFSSVVHDRLMHLFCLLCRRSCSLVPWFFGTLLIFLPTVLVLLWTSFSLRLLSQPASLSTRVRIAAPLRLFVAPCSLPTTCCALVVLTFPRLLCLLFQPIRPCNVCTTGPLWITVSLLGTSPSWPTSLAHSLTFVCVLPFWTLSLTLSRGSSVAVLRITLVVAPGPAHAQGSLFGGSCSQRLMA